MPLSQRKDSFIFKSSSTAMKLAEDNGWILIGDDPEVPVPYLSERANTVRFLTSILAEECIKISLPQSISLNAEDILIPREKLKDLLIPFRMTMQKLSMQLKIAIKDSRDINVIKSEAKYIAESQVEPAIFEIKKKIEEAIIVGIIPNEYNTARNYLLENRENWLEDMELIPDSANDKSKNYKSNVNEIKLKPKVESINDIFELETKEDELIIKWIKQGISVLMVVINDSKNLKLKNTGNFTYSSIIKRLKEESWEIEPNQKLYIFFKQKLIFIAQIDSENQIIFGKEFKGYSENDVLFYSHTKGEYKGLSNFYHSEIEIDNRKYQTVEHFYQACKATNEKDFDEIANSGDPYSSKELGNSLPNRSDWDEIKYQLMMKGLYAKYTQHNDLKELLLSTGDSPIHENTFNDRYWGYFDGLGRDMLGKALMETREKLKKNIIISNQ